MSIHVVTGGTGFIGAALILELLRQTDADILCLVRQGKGDIDTRLLRVLHKAALTYGYDRQIMDLAQRRCSVLAGDLCAPFCGCAPGVAGGQVEQFWHCAACLKHEDEYQEEVYKVNVQGTQHALDLAERLDTRAFNYISTAYVAGKRSGVLYEQFHAEYEHNNYYERSKWLTEPLVAHTRKFRTRIFRPSLVIGHSKTYAVSGELNGLYLLAQRLGRQREVLMHLGTHDVTIETLRMCADPQYPVNMIAVDQVARQAVAIAHSGSDASIFHLTNSTPPTLRTLMNAIAEVLKFKRPLYVSSREQFTDFDHLFARSIDFFNAHLLGQNKSFDRRQSNAALGNERAGDFLLDEETLKRYIRWSMPLLPSVVRRTDE